MNKKMIWVLIIPLVLVFITFFFLGKTPATNNSSESAQNISKVKIGDAVVNVELANTPAKRTQGLMFRESMSRDQGMLFIFPNEAKHTFWMANTKIKLDIIWISKDKKIVHISKNTPPCTETGNLKAMCKTYSSDEKALYVLEVNGGWTDQNKVKIQDSIEFL